MYFHGMCHPDASVTACYVMATGTMRLTCARCGHFVASVAVAAE
jgi:hypothetical protein